MELLIGSGHKLAKQVTFEGIPKEWIELVTLDHNPDVKPSVIHDLNELPYPFADDTFDEIHGYEILEHCGKQGEWRFFFDQFTEFYRIMKPDAYFVATVPLWDSKWAWGDPSHTRIINDGTLVFLSQPQYEEQAGKTSMSDFRWWYKADFDIISVKEEGDMFGFVLQAIKPSRAKT